jgi:hypothetical protein
LPAAATLHEMSESTVVLLDNLVGRSVGKIRRVYYVHGDEIDRHAGALELTLDDGTVLLFDSASDGEALRVHSGSWDDPFKPPLSAEDQEYIRQHGRYSLFDVGDEPRYLPLVGATITHVLPMTASNQKIVGVRLATSHGDLPLLVGADELLVDPPDRLLVDLRQT